ncbi:hypothetical protein Tco_1576659, partial [Tanacetum coccineum]
MWFQGSLYVDATVLQYKNQKLVQQLEVQKQELHDLDDDLILLVARAGADQSALEALQRADSSR